MARRSQPHGLRRDVEQSHRARLVPSSRWAGVVSDWIRDGHTARVTLQHDELSVQLVCPNQGDYTDISWDGMPSCRKPYGEDGQPDYDASAYTYCNFAEWATADGQPLDCIDTDVTRGDWLINGEFPIAWRWTGDTYLWAPSVLVEIQAGVA